MRTENRPFNAAIFLPLAAIIVLASAGCAGKRAKMKIVENGEAKSVMVLPSDAGEDVRYAALELRDYIRKISGAEIPIRTGTADPRGIRIFVGSDRPAGGPDIRTDRLSGEGFVIKTVGNDLVLAGRDDAGTQHAVYTFLEKYLGIRWLWPGEFGEIVPVMKTISVGRIDDTQEPDFIWRDRGPGGALWGASSGPTEMHARERLLGITSEHQKAVELWEKRNKWGGIKIYGGHALGEIFPPEKFARIHPEYYALVDGRRDVPGTDYDYKHEGQICTTNPDVREVAVKWVRNFFNENPEYDGVRLTMNDGGGFCECEQCRALDTGDFVDRPGIDTEEMKKRPAKYTVITDRIFTFINQVTEEVQKTHPGKYIVSMAYSRYTLPPRRIELNPFVIPQYCLWSSYKHANTDIKKQHEDIASGWAKAANKKGIYEYFINGYWPGMHRLVTAYIAVSIKYLYSQGIDLYQTQSGDEFGVNGINYYVAGKLLWDTSMNEERILKDYYNKGFGNAAEAIERFHTRLAKAWTVATEAGQDVSCQSLENNRLLELFTPQLIKACHQDLMEAEKVADDETVRKRVEFLGQGFQYTELTVEAVTAAERLMKSGVPLFPVETAKREIAKLSPETAVQLVREAIAAWEMRDRFIEELKNDYVISYFWAKYSDLTRNLNPIDNLREMARELDKLPPSLE